MATSTSSARLDDAPAPHEPRPRAPAPRRTRWYAPLALAALGVAVLLTARIHWSVPVLLVWIFAPLVAGLRAWWVRGERGRPFDE